MYIGWTLDLLTRTTSLFHQLFPTPLSLTLVTKEALLHVSRMTATFPTPRFAVVVCDVIGK
jgi:hypothetical protein